MCDSSCLQVLEERYEQANMFIECASEKVPKRCGKVRFGPSGYHFFDRATGLNILIDEVVPASKLWSLAPRFVSIALTNRCDLACSYCYAPKSNHSLPFKAICSWLQELDTNGCLGVGFGGGEPLLYNGFLELCTYMERDTGLAVTFTTHGHHFDEKTQTQLCGRVNFVRVSMDGIHETYEKLRNRPFARLVDALHRVRDTARFGINTVVNEATVGELDEIADFALKIGSEELLLLPERKTKSVKGIDSRNMSALIKWISSYRGGLRLATSDHSEFGELTNCPHGKQSDLTEYAHIDACGNLKRSSFDDSGIPIGTGGVLCALATLNSDRGFSP